MMCGDMRLIVFNVDLWIGTARLPAALKRTGFEVAALCTADTFLASTRHVDGRFIIENGDAATVAKAFADAMTRWQPDLVIPGDERVLHFLHRVVEAADDGKPLGLSREAVEVVKRSLPARSHF
jgi:hypothetical protein